MARADSERKQALSALSSLSMQLEEAICESGIAFCCEVIQERANLPRQLGRLQSSSNFIKQVKRAIAFGSHIFRIKIG